MLEAIDTFTKFTLVCDTFAFDFVSVVLCKIV